MKQAVEKYELPIEILPEHIDQLGHVNNVVYLRWVQDAAIAHWSAAAPENEQEKLLWVVTRHEIDYKRPALPGDKIADSLAPELALYSHLVRFPALPHPST